MHPGAGQRRPDHVAGRVRAEHVDHGAPAARAHAPASATPAPVLPIRRSIGSHGERIGGRQRQRGHPDPHVHPEAADHQQVEHGADGSPTGAAYPGPGRRRGGVRAGHPRGVAARRRARRLGRGQHRAGAARRAAPAGRRGNVRTRSPPATPRWPPRSAEPPSPPAPDTVAAHPAHPGRLAARLAGAGPDRRRGPGPRAGHPGRLAGARPGVRPGRRAALLRAPATASPAGARGRTLRHLAELADFAADLVARGRVLPGVDRPGRAGAVDATGRRHGARPGGVAAAAHRHRRRLGPVAGAGPAPGGPGRRHRAGRPTSRTAGVAGRRRAGRADRRRRPGRPRRHRAGPRRAAGAAPVTGLAGRARPGRAATSPPTRPRWTPSGRAGRTGSATPPVARCGPASAWSSRPPTRSPSRLRRWCRPTRHAVVTGRVGRWRLEFGLQAADEPGLLVDAGQVWRAPETRCPGSAAPASPQETLLAELGRASRLWPELDDALRTADAGGDGAGRRGGAPVPQRGCAGAARGRLRGAAAVLVAAPVGAARRPAARPQPDRARARSPAPTAASGWTPWSTTAGRWRSATSRCPPRSWPRWPS